MKKLLLSLLAISIICALFPSPAPSQTSLIANGAPKYVFLFLSDGAGPAHLEIARQYRQHIHNEGMVIVDKIMKEGSVGVMTTHAADSLSTDSAAVSNSPGQRLQSQDRRARICADGTIPISAMEIARRRGMKLGSITNSTIYDSSPAAFLCHVPNRTTTPSILKRYLEMDRRMYSWAAEWINSCPRVTRRPPHR